METDELKRDLAYKRIKKAVSHLMRIVRNIFNAPLGG